MKKLFYKLLALFVIVFPFSAIGLTPASENVSEHFNPAMIVSWLFIILIILFALVIYVLGKVLISTTEQKIKRNMKNATKALLIPSLFIPSFASAQEAASTGLGFNTQFGFWYLLIGVLIVELIVIIVFAVVIRNNMQTEKDKELAKSTSSPFAFLTSGKFWDKLNNAKKLEEEKSILLDHDYDGIQELDNDLPPWWKYGFILTIIWAVGYLFYYHVSSNGISSIQEYENEIAEAEVKVAAYKASLALNVDENTVTQMTETADIAEGKAVFERMNCASCHNTDGGGGIGPNLTDKYWIHGGDVVGIFKTIKYGANNGMKAWEDDMSAIEIQQITSYVMSLQGTTPAEPKEPEGDLYTPANQEMSDSMTTSDSLNMTQELTIN